jgi:hypothetical protein
VYLVGLHVCDNFCVYLSVNTESGKAVT